MATYSEDGKWMWDGTDWIPAPPKQNPEVPGNTISQKMGGLASKVTEKVTQLSQNQPSEPARLQVIELVTNLSEKVDLYKRRRKLFIFDVISIILIYAINGIFVLNTSTYDGDSIRIYYVIVLVITLSLYITLRYKRKRKLDLVGKERVRIWELTSAVKSIDPLIGKFDSHQSLAEYVELKSKINSNLIGGMILGSAAAVIGTAVIYSQMKKK
jgi:hypothetical protein